MQVHRFVVLLLAAIGSLAHAHSAAAGEPVKGVNVSIEQCCMGGVTFGGLDNPEIPAGGFGPGSPAFTGTINLHSTAPLQLERLADANFSLGADTIDIELLPLQLVSTGPVAFDGALWDVSVSLSAPALGQMTLDHNAASEGGSVLSGFLNLPLDYVFSATGRGTVAVGRIETVSLVGGPTGWDHPVGDPTGLVYLDPLDFSSPNGDVTLSFTQVPEPTTALLVGLGFLVLGARGRRERVSRMCCRREVAL